MEYDVVVSPTVKMLTATVNMYIDVGYKPIGGVSLSMDNYGNQKFSQAVIKGD